jgi:hypothetical protein
MDSIDRSVQKGGPCDRLFIGNCYPKSACVRCAIENMVVTALPSTVMTGKRWPVSLPIPRATRADERRDLATKEVLERWSHIKE